MLPQSRFLSRASLMLASLLVAGSLSAETPPPAADVNPVASPERTRWFQEARFGMFIHWGVYAVPAGEWQGKPVRGIGEWIMKNGSIPCADYRAFASQFTAENYVPTFWAKLAREAGMKYIVITSKHHDGFALYDSAVTDWDSVDASAAKRDLLKPLAEAARAEGLRFGLYYSQAQDWMHRGGAIAGNAPEWDAAAHEGDFDAYLTTIAVPQTREIIEKFSPDIIWWDTPSKMNKDRAVPFLELLAAHPQILTNDRLGGGNKGDTRTPEQHIPPRGYPGEFFEVCMTMNNTWGYRKDDNNWKSLRQLVRNLSDISSKGGNFLLNVGPTAQGEIPAPSIERLQAMGRWMNTNSEAIYATQASPFPRRLAWGRMTQKQQPDGSHTLYVHVWDWPSDGSFILPTLRQLPKGGYLLANGKKASFQLTDEGLQVSVPGTAPDPDVSVLRLDFADPIVVTQDPFLKVGPDGTVLFMAEDADAHGHWDGNIQYVDAKPESYLTDWKNARWRLEYLFMADTAQTWEIIAEIAAPEASSVLVVVDKTETPVTVEPTGPDLTWKDVSLGTVSLAQGTPSFSIKGDSKGWKPISIRKVKLVPRS